VTSQPEEFFFRNFPSGGVSSATPGLDAIKSSELDSARNGPGCIGLFYVCTLSSASGPFAHETRTGTPLETSAIFIDPFAFLFSPVGLSVQHLTVFCLSRRTGRGGLEKMLKKTKEGRY
jgi:hypothetical protein